MPRKHPVARLGSIASVVLVASMASTTPAQDRGSQPPPLGGPVLDLRVRLVVDLLDPPPDYNTCGATSALVAYTGENVR